MSFLRTSFVLGVLVAVATPTVSFAAFAGPSQVPPQANVPGVVWNRSAANENLSQPGAEYNVAGSGRIGGDFYLSDSKALRVDSQGDTWLNFGNWNTGKFTLNVIGDIQTDKSDGAEGSITAPKFCIGTSCITSWPGGGGGGAGTITGVSAGTGITGGGTTGNVTINFDPTYGDGRYLRLSGGTLSGALTLPGNPTTNLQAATKQYVDSVVGAAGGGTITGVTAGTGLTGGGTVGTVTVGLDAAHADGSAYDNRFINVDGGDSMTGSLYAPDYTGKSFKFDNGIGDVIQTRTYQTLGQTGVLELVSGGTQKLRFMNADGSLIYSNNASSYPTSYFNFLRGDGLTLRGLTSNYGLNTSDAVGALGVSPAGPYHTSVSLSASNAPVSHTGVDSGAYTQTGIAGNFFSYWNGVRGVVLGTKTNAAEFTGNVCINGDCKSAWPGGAGTVTQVTAGTGLLGGPITSSGALSLDTTFTDGRYVNANGDSMSDSLTINATSAAIGFSVTGQSLGINATAGTTGINAYGGTSAGYFQNSSNTAYRGWVGYNGYGGYFAAPAAGIALYSSGLTQLNGNTTVTGALTVSGDITASGNTLAGCSWTAYTADTTAIMCPASAPIMSGIQRSGTTMRAYCCAL